MPSIHTLVVFTSVQPIQNNYKYAFLKLKHTNIVTHMNSAYTKPISYTILTYVLHVHFIHTLMTHIEIAINKYILHI